jgi:pheromone shutdown protein TraB
MKEDIKFLTQYYGINGERNSVFVKNMEKRLDKNAKNEIVIVVTGGFHSEGLNKIFTQNRISYISLMPSVTQETKTAEENYNSFLAKGNVFAAQTLALALASQAQSAEMAQMMIETASSSLSSLSSFSRGSCGCVGGHLGRNAGNAGNGCSG